MIHNYSNGINITSKEVVKVFLVFRQTGIVKTNILILKHTENRGLCGNKESLLSLFGVMMAFSSEGKLLKI